MRENSRCNYEAKVEYIASYSAGTGGWGVQGCLYDCMRMGDCSVVLWPNKAEKYSDPELKDYDTRACYRVFVDSATECQTRPRDSDERKDVYTLTGPDVPAAQKPEAPIEPPIAAAQTPVTNPVWTWTVGEAIERTCSLSVTNGLTKQIIAELISMGYPLTELDGLSIDLASQSSSGKATNVAQGSKCTEESCVPYLLSQAATALKQAPQRIGFTTDAGEEVEWNLANSVWLLGSAYRSPIQQHVLTLWKDSKRCGIWHADLPGTSQAERGIMIDLAACVGDYYTKGGWLENRKGDPTECAFQGQALIKEGYLYSGAGYWGTDAPSNHFIHVPSASYALVKKNNICSRTMKGIYLGSTYNVQGCADLCAQYGYGCALFKWHISSEGAKGCNMLVDKNTGVAVASDSQCDDSWSSSDFYDTYTLTGSAKPVKEDTRTAGIRAFQKLWNRYNPHDQIPVDGTYSSPTAERMSKAPVNGFNSQSGRRTLQQHGHEGRSHVRRLGAVQYRLIATKSKCRLYPNTIPLGAVTPGSEAAAQCANKCIQQPGCVVFLTMGANGEPRGRGIKMLDYQMGCYWAKGDYGPANEPLPQAPIRSALDCPGNPPGTLDKDEPQYVFDDWEPYDSYELYGPGYGVSHWQETATPSAWPQESANTFQDVIGSTSSSNNCDARQLIAQYEGQPSDWKAFQSKYARSLSWARMGLKAVGSELDSFCCAIRNALIDIAYQYGSLSTLARMLKALVAYDWDVAATRAQQTAWYRAAGYRGKDHVRTLSQGCTAKNHWKKAPTASQTFSKGGKQKQSERQAGEYDASFATNGAPKAEPDLPSLRSHAVNSMSAYKEAVKHQLQTANQEQTSALRLDDDASGVPSGIGSTPDRYWSDGNPCGSADFVGNTGCGLGNMGYQLFAQKSCCNYGADREYLGNYYAQAGEHYGSYSQNYQSGLQTCANECANTPGCTVFAWQNYREEYNDPSLKNYDSRPCYYVKVDSTQQCGTSIRDQSCSRIDIYTITGSRTPIPLSSGRRLEGMSADKGGNRTVGGHFYVTSTLPGGAYGYDARPRSGGRLLQTDGFSTGLTTPLASCGIQTHLTTSLGRQGSLDQTRLHGALVGTHVALSQGGGHLSSVCCSVRNYLTEFTYDAGFGEVRRYRKLWANVALSNWDQAANELDGNWCRRNRHRCTLAKAALSTGCPDDVYFMLEEGYVYNQVMALGVEQRMVPAYNVPPDPRWATRAAQWQKPGDTGYTRSNQIHQCLEPSVALHPEQLKWWASPRTQPGTEALGQFVSKHFGYLLTKPYSHQHAYNCRRNTASKQYWSVHSEGRAIDFFIPTQPCGTQVHRYYYGHPTCNKWPGGSARNDLGDRLMMWLAEHAMDIGVEYLIYDRTAWSRRSKGFKPYNGAHPHNEHIHLELTRAASAMMNTPFFQDMVGYVPKATQYPPLSTTETFAEWAGSGRRLNSNEEVPHAEYELVLEHSWCKFGAESTYLASYDQEPSLLQDYLPGLQACANKCAVTAGCTVFTWKNYEEDYHSPELADYDNRPCYWVHVASAADCGGRQPGSEYGKDAYTLTGQSMEIMEELLEDTVAGSEEEPPDGTLVSLEVSNARWATGSNGQILVSYGGNTQQRANTADATYQLVRRHSWCKFGAQTTYLASYDQEPSLLQDWKAGLQACANKCASVSDCVVFSWKNHKEEYYDPELADYDNRPCYMVHVATAAECGGRQPSEDWNKDIYTLYTPDDSMTLVFDLTVTVSGQILCPNGWYDKHAFMCNVPLCPPSVPSCMSACAGPCLLVQVRCS